MSHYTPTTEDIRRVARTLSTCREFDPEMCDGCDKRVQEAERLLNSSWLVEVKAQAFDLGAASQRNAYARNIYREGNK